MKLNCEEGFKILCKLYNQFLRNKKNVPFFALTTKINSVSVNESVKEFWNELKSILLNGL